MRYLETTRVSIAELEPYPGNARTHDEDALDESAKVNGQYRSVVARRVEDRLQLLAGHGTVNAFARRGDPDVRVEVIEADDTEARRIVLADNATSRNAGYDEQLLLDLIDQASKDGGLPGTGWDEAAYRELLDAVGEDTGFSLNHDPDEDDVEPPADPVSALGDLWRLGPHRVLCGDSTSRESLGQVMGTDLADCIWTDPPYGVEYVGKTKEALTIKSDGAAGLPALLEGAFSVGWEYAQPGAAFYVAAPAGPLHMVFMDHLRNRGYRQTLVWVKSSMVLGHSDYHYKHEPIFYGYVPGYRGRRGRGGGGWFGDHSQVSVLEFDKPGRNRDHPTMKPIGLVGYCLKNSTGGGGVVLDMFGGSGTSLIASHVAGRSARLVELDPRYVDVICRRYQELTGDKPILESTGEPHDFTADA